MGQEEIDQQFGEMIDSLRDDFDPKQIAMDEAMHDPQTEEIARILLEGVPIDDELLTQRLQEIATRYGITLQEADDAVALSAALYLENDAQVAAQIDREMEE